MIACARGWDDHGCHEHGGRTGLRYDWSARARTTALDALRYTQFRRRDEAGRCRWAPFAVIAAVLAFFFFQRQPRQLQMAFEQLGHVDNDLAMVKPRLTGPDAKGNPFVITADAAVQDAKNPKRARLKKVEADLALDKKRWINARAAPGMVDMKAGQLELNGGIDVFSDTGYDCTRHARRPISSRA